MFTFAGAQTGLPFRIKIQANYLIPKYMKMSRMQVDLESAAQLKVETIPAGIEPGDRRASGHS